MSTKPTQLNAAPNVVEPPLSLKDLGVILIKHYGLHHGLYDPMIEYQIGIGAIGPNEEAKGPGLMVGISRIGLAKVDLVQSQTIDAAEVNPNPIASATIKPARKKAAQKK